MRSVIKVGLCLAFSSLVLSAALAQAADVLRTRMETAAASNALNDPQLMPWHLKLAIQLFDMKGNPTEAGSVEEWWSKPDAFRVDYAFPSYTGSELQTPAGAFRSTGPGAPPDMARTILHQVSDPLPAPDELRTSTPDLRKESFGGAGYDCIMLDQPLKDVAYPPLGLFPTYCFERAHNVLGASLEYGTELTLRNKLGFFQKKTVPMSLSVDVNQVKVAAGQITVLQGRPTPYNEASNTSGLVAVALPAGVPGGVVAGNIITKVAPYYPAGAKARHISGTVILHAIIGRDGHVRRLSLVKVPDADLAIAAIAAVRQWTYKPYLLNGEPTEVDTTVTVNFRLD